MRPGQLIFCTALLDTVCELSVILLSRFRKHRVLFISCLTASVASLLRYDVGLCYTHFELVTRWVSETMFMFLVYTFCYINILVFLC